MWANNISFWHWIPYSQMLVTHNTDSFSQLNNKFHSPNITRIHSLQCFSNNNKLSSNKLSPINNSNSSSDLPHSHRSHSKLWCHKSREFLKILKLVLNQLPLPEFLKSLLLELFQLFQSKSPPHSHQWLFQSLRTYQNFRSQVLKTSSRSFRQFREPFLLVSPNSLESSSNHLIHDITRSFVNFKSSY